MFNGDAVREVLGDPLGRSDSEVLSEVLREMLGRIPSTHLEMRLELSAR